MSVDIEALLRKATPVQRCDPVVQITGVPPIPEGSSAIVATFPRNHHHFIEDGSVFSKDCMSVDIAVTPPPPPPPQPPTQTPAPTTSGSEAAAGPADSEDSEWNEAGNVVSLIELGKNYPLPHPPKKKPSPPYIHEAGVLL